MALRITKNKPLSPFQNEISRLSDVLSDMGMVMVKTDNYQYQMIGKTMVKTDNYQYQMMYADEKMSKGKIVPFSEITKDREALRELLSVATDMLFDGDLE